MKDFLHRLINYDLLPQERLLLCIIRSYGDDGIAFNDLMELSALDWADTDIYLDALKQAEHVVIRDHRYHLGDRFIDTDRNQP